MMQTPRFPSRTASTPTSMPTTAGRWVAPLLCSFQSLVLDVLTGCSSTCREILTDPGVRYLWGYGVDEMWELMWPAQGVVGGCFV